MMMTSTVDPKESITSSSKLSSPRDSLGEEGAKSTIIVSYRLMPNVLDEKLIPDLTNMQPWQATEAVAKLLEIDDDETNFKSFWIVDTLACSLKQLQDKRLQQTYQKLFINWFFYVLENINAHNWSREEAFSTLKLLMLRAEKTILSKSSEDISVQVRSEMNTRRLSAVENDRNVDKDEGFEIITARDLSELGSLIDIIYNIFANRFKYEVIRTTFANTTTWESIEVNDAMNLPRTLLVEATEKPARKEQGKLRSLKGSAVITTTDDTSEEQILPLIKSVDQTFFDKLFPKVSSAKKNETKKEKKKKKT